MNIDKNGEGELSTVLFHDGVEGELSGATHIHAIGNLDSAPFIDALRIANVDDK